ncbi:MAG TPA: hypothetical protein VGF55_07035 [Gemmataceae bacterium]|jgi:hypothetical protein
MDIAFATRSRFLDSCEDAIRRGRADLDAGGAVRVLFEEGGYPGRVVVTIREGDSGWFGTDWEGADETRFPARIKAAATALMHCGCTGRFLIAHTDGAMEISRA